MLRRIAFKPKVPTRRPARQYDGVSAGVPAKRLPCAAVDGTVLVQPIVKPEKAKAGKRTPTAAEARWMAAIVEYGCVACRIDGVPPRPTAVHHLLRGGKRIGHLFTIGLCDPGHHQGGDALGLVSRHPWKARFERRYGPETHLLARLRIEIGAL